MTLRWIGLALVHVVALGLGCGGDKQQTDAGIDSPPPRACDGRAYDRCTDTAGATDCMAGLTCRFYMQQNFTICTPSCDTMTACPADENGTAVSCNMMGRCRSDAPNNCYLP